MRVAVAARRWIGAAATRGAREAHHQAAQGAKAANNSKWGVAAVAAVTAAAGGVWLLPHVDRATESAAAACEATAAASGGAAGNGNGNGRAATKVSAKSQDHDKINPDGFAIFSGRANPALAQEIADELGVKLGSISIKGYADGEIGIQVNENVRGKDVYIVQPTSPPGVNDQLVELLLLVSTMRRASAMRITCVVPYYGYGRQDRKMASRVPISAADVARLLQAMGVDRVVAVDLHCIAEGTLVNLDNGTAIPIEQVRPGDCVLGYDEQGAEGCEGVRARRVTAVHDRGARECVELQFEDGRTLVCTPDHQLRTHDGSWVEAAKLKAGISRVSATAEFAADSRSDEETWQLRVSESEVLRMDTIEARDRALVFARLCGCTVAQAAEAGAGTLALRHQMDAELAVKDIRLLTGLAPAVLPSAREYLVPLPGALRQWMAAASLAATALSDPACPAQIAREFLAGMLGAAECAFDVTCLRCKLSGDVQRLALALLQRCGVEAASVGAEIQISAAAAQHFEQRVGFRLSSDKQLRLTAACSAWRNSTSAQQPCASVSPQARMLPLFAVKLVSKRSVGLRRTFDLTVPTTKCTHGASGSERVQPSFVAGGIVAHNCGQIQGFFGPRCPCDNLEAHVVALPFFKELGLRGDTTKVVSPDAGGVYRAKRFRDGLSQVGVDAGLAMIVKQRTKPNEIGRMDLVGDVQGCDVVMVDDMIDTAGTLTAAAHELKVMGAKRIFAFATHGLFSGPAYERIAKSDLEKVVVCNTVPLQSSADASKIVQISIAGLLADAIRRIHLKKSVSALFSSDTPGAEKSGAGAKGGATATASPKKSL